MSFAVHPEDEDFLTKFGQHHSARGKARFWPSPCPDKQREQREIIAAQDADHARASDSNLHC
jgi:hypothetical protein